MNYLVHFRGLNMYATVEFRCFLRMRDTLVFAKDFTPLKTITASGTYQEHVLSKFPKGMLKV